MDNIYLKSKTMRLSEDVIRYMNVKQEGPLPTPRSSNKGAAQSEKAEIDHKLKKDC